jgi:Holliday junction DNA helicase RuvA
MIGRLTGKVVAQEPEGAIVVDVAGVGYELFTPFGAAGRAAVEDDGRATFYVHTHAREDALTLFGFATEADRGAFRTLIGVSSVGPKTALAVLGVLPADDLAGVIAGRELTKLTAIPGIGKKTAERLVLELRDRLTKFPAATSSVAAAQARSAGAANPRELLLGALTRMGYRPAEAERAAMALAARLGSDPLPDLVREALALLAK